MSVAGARSLDCTCALPTELLLKVFDHLDRRSLLCIGASSRRLRDAVSELEDYYFVYPLLGPVNNASLFWTRNANFKSRWSDLGDRLRLLRVYLYANSGEAAGEMVDFSGMFDDIYAALRIGLVTHLEVKVDFGPMPLPELHRLFTTAAPGLRTLHLQAQHKECRLPLLTFADSAPLLHKVTVVGSGHFAPGPQLADSQRGPNVAIAGAHFVDLQSFDLSELHVLGYRFGGAERMIVNIDPAMGSWSAGRDVWPLSPTIRSLEIDLTDLWCRANGGISGDAVMIGKIRDILTHVIAHWQLGASTRLILSGFYDNMPLGATLRVIEIFEACSASQTFSVQIYLPGRCKYTLRLSSSTRSRCELHADLWVMVRGTESRWSPIVGTIVALGTRVRTLEAPPEFFNHLEAHPEDLAQVVGAVPNIYKMQPALPGTIEPTAAL